MVQGPELKQWAEKDFIRLKNELNKKDSAVENGFVADGAAESLILAEYVNGERETVNISVSDMATYDVSPTVLLTHVMQDRTADEKGDIPYLDDTENDTELETIN